MKKVAKKLSLGFLALVFLMTITSASPVEAFQPIRSRKPLRLDFTATYLGGVLWEGDAWMKDGCHAAFSMVLTDYTLYPWGQTGKMDWHIEWDAGGYLHGTFNMIFIYTTYEYGLDGGLVFGSGEVTETTPDWSELDGGNVFVFASISPWPWVGDGVLVIR